MSRRDVNSRFNLARFALSARLPRDTAPIVNNDVAERFAPSGKFHAVDRDDLVFAPSERFNSGAAGRYNEM